LFKTEIQKTRAKQKLGLILLIIGFALIPVESMFWKNQLFSGVIGLTGAYLLVKAYFLVSQKVKCPKCSKSLGYLLTNSEYTKNNFSYLLCSTSLPEGIDSCPYCGEKLN